MVDGKQAGKSAGTTAIYVTPNYFSVLRIPLLAGRGILKSDTAESEPVVVVNAAFTRKNLGTSTVADALGMHVDTEGKTFRIVGVAGDVMKTTGSDVEAPLMAERTLYVPAAQWGIKVVARSHEWFQPSWIVRTRGTVGGLSQQMQAALASVDRGLPFAGFFSMEQLRAQALSQQRVEVMLLGTVALLALLLSTIGVYSLISNMVVQRTREIGIRIALGSTISQAMVIVGRSGMTATAIGIAAGIACATLGVRVLRSVLFGISPYDPVTFAGSIVLLLVVGFIAAFVPTMRIAKIDPAETLRSE